MEHAARPTDASVRRLPWVVDSLFRYSFSVRLTEWVPSSPWGPEMAVGVIVVAVV